MKLLMNHKNSLMIHGPISLNNEVLMFINDHEIFIKKSQPGTGLGSVYLIHESLFNIQLFNYKSKNYFNFLKYPKEHRVNFK
jgi:hypothetical protein